MQHHTQHNLQHYRNTSTRRQTLAKAEAQQSIKARCARARPCTTNYPQVAIILFSTEVSSRCFFSCYKIRHVHIPDACPNPSTGKSREVYKQVTSPPPPTRQLSPRQRATQTKINVHLGSSGATSRSVLEEGDSQRSPKNAPTVNHSLQKHKKQPNEKKKSRPAIISKHQYMSKKIRCITKTAACIDINE